LTGGDVLKAAFGTLNVLKAAFRACLLYGVT
jgi:hypothetical protein